MKRFLFIAVALSCIAVMQPRSVFAGPADRKSLLPATTLDAGGSLRMRYEWKQGFSLGKSGALDPQDYLLSQLRLHLNLHHGDA